MSIKTIAGYLVQSVRDSEYLLNGTQRIYDMTTDLPKNREGTSWLKLQNFLPLFVLFCLPLVAQIRELPSPTSNASEQLNLAAVSYEQAYLSCKDRMEGCRVAFAR